MFALQVVETAKGLAKEDSSTLPLWLGLIALAIAVIALAKYSATLIAVIGGRDEHWRVKLHEQRAADAERWARERELISSENASLRAELVAVCRDTMPLVKDAACELTRCSQVVRDNGRAIEDLIARLTKTGRDLEEIVEERRTNPGITPVECPPPTRRGGRR